MMEAYFEGREPSREQIVATIHKGIIAGDIQPVLVASAERLIGIDLLAEFIVDYGPNPLERTLPALSNGDPISPSHRWADRCLRLQIGVRPLRRAHFSLSYLLRHGQGRPGARCGGRRQGQTPQSLQAPGQGAQRRAGSSCRWDRRGGQGRQPEVGDTLRSSGTDITIAPISYPRPVAEVAITPRSHHDEEKLSTALHRIEEEDPTVRVERRADTGETILAGLGDTHLDVTVARIHRKFGVEVDTALPIIPYRETITTSAKAEGKHKKQSGGRGQFGVAFVKFAPLPRGSGYEYIDSIKGGSIPRQFIPAVDKGIQEALNRGVLAGYPLIDISAEVYDGKYHAVDSDEMSFRMAGIQACEGRDTGPQTDLARAGHEGDDHGARGPLGRRHGRHQLKAWESARDGLRRHTSYRWSPRCPWPRSSSMPAELRSLTIGQRNLRRGVRSLRRGAAQRGANR